jgi:hypothetical protein
MPSLPELQARFAAALRGDPAAILPDIDDDGLEPAGRLRVYRHNSTAMFDGALERSYPILRRRVGDDYFRRLAHEYRSRHPSRSADLHWIGERFPAYLAETHAGGGYAWLAELAGLEWACESALVAGNLPPLGLASLSTLDPGHVDQARLELQPSLRCIASSFPVLDVWRANQPDGDGQPADLSKGPQCILVSCGADGLELREVDTGTLDFTRRLQAGAGLGEALDASGLPVESLVDALGLLFMAHLVTGLLPPREEAA